MKAIMQHMAKQALHGTDDNIQFKLSEFIKKEEATEAAEATEATEAAEATEATKQLDEWLLEKGVEKTDIPTFKAALGWDIKTKGDFEQWEKAYLEQMEKNPRPESVFDKVRGRALMTSMIQGLIRENVGIFTFQEMDGMRYKTFTEAAPYFDCTLRREAVSECGKFNPCNMNADTFYARTAAPAEGVCSIM